MGYADAVKQLSPTAYWRLGESAWGTFKDSSGNGHDAVASGSATNFTPADASLLPGDPDAAFKCNVDGTTTGSISAAAGTWVRATTMSISFVIKKAVAPASDYGAVVTPRVSGGGQIYAVYIPSEAAKAGYGGKVNFLGFTGTGLTNDFTLATSASVCDGKAHHIVITLNGTAWKLYRNGVQEGSITASSSLYLGTAADSPLYLGSEGLTRGLGGTVDEIAMWNGAELTASQVALLYREMLRGGVVL